MPSEVSEREQKVLNIIETARAKKQKFRDTQITMAHGAGGKATQGLIEGLLVPAFANETLEAMADAGTVDVLGGQIAMTTDSFVVSPIVFPGGTIGDLAVNGTINDVAMAGARPLALTLSLILEEGLPADELKHQVAAIAAAAAEAGVNIVAGDTKVVPRGMCDKMYICTTGIGVLDDRANLSPVRAAARRQDPRVRPDRRPRHRDHARPRRVRARRRHHVGHDVPLADGRQAAGRSRSVAALPARRDPRRRRIGARTNLRGPRALRWSSRRPRCQCTRPWQVPAEILGIDPMHVANEGKLVAIVAPEAADAALAALRSMPGGEEAAEIGECKTEPEGMVLMATAFGGKRVMDQLVGDPLPRIC